MMYVVTSVTGEMAINTNGLAQYQITRLEQSSDRTDVKLT